ncbi:zf-HC2 domain-containing protein [Corynebacterium aquatimens]|uniref:Anti-sigma-YlaC factor YlaD n=1 Tax=Corynebacterium aquatimens TaxID=1190508 RepID=A0A931DY62_9CORY|nr:zf-HC2 domain-containing protein [Corynebacterium aquatimens]MBG6121144.1 putative anti-sigma-YlaC factor YlaD [Corynebacterium aquatimens]WJY66301.1 hypothetical protein CAQUA_08035 [Corynebacterium aquatimens]
MISHDEVQAALSARIDGEESTVDAAVVEAHVAHCDKCRAYWERAVALSDNFGAANANDFSPPVDLADSILAGVEGEFQRVAARRQVGVAIARVVLACLSALYVVWAGRLVVEASRFSVETAAGDVAAAGADPMVGTLLIGAAAVRIGIAVALLFAAWKPQQLIGVLIIVGAMLGFTLGFTVLAAVSGTHQMPWGEVSTLAVTCAALCALWAADSGVFARRPWRQLGASPTSWA